MKNRVAMLAVVVVVALSTTAMAFGGWAVVTVDDLPDYLVAGQPVTLSFVVRQHGVTRLTGLSPSVVMWSGDTRTSTPARPMAEAGRYTYTVTVPRAGDWSFRIQSGFGPSNTTLLPITAVAAGAQPPRLVADHVRGMRLFHAKGCVTCHVRGSLGGDGIRVGPELTGKRYVADYVATFLADPDASPLSKQTNSDLRMPKLDLKPREIASLVAFLNSDASTATAGTSSGAR